MVSTHLAFFSQVSTALFSIKSHRCQQMCNVYISIYTDTRTTLMLLFMVILHYIQTYTNWNVGISIFASCPCHLASNLSLSHLVMQLGLSIYKSSYATLSFSMLHTSLYDKSKDKYNKKHYKNHSCKMLCH